MGLFITLQALKKGTNQILELKYRLAVGSENFSFLIIFCFEHPLGHAFFVSNLYKIHTIIDSQDNTVHFNFQYTLNESYI